MKQYIKSGVTIMLSLFAITASAQNLTTAYFTDGYYYRHQMNPAISNDSTSYLSVPVLGNIDISEHSSFGIKDVIFDNPMYPNSSQHKLTTFMNPYISAEEALKGFDKDNNRVLSDIKIGILSAGWRAWGGYNTLDLNLRMHEGASLPYELFEFAKNTGNKRYEIGDIMAQAESFAELALGHSRNINDKLRVGAKLKVLLGIAKADLSMKNVVADLSGTDRWTVQGDIETHMSMKGFKYKSEYKDYEAEGAGKYECVDDVDVDGGGLGGFGLAVDLGASYKVMEDLTISASIVDLGFVSWSNDMFAKNLSDKFTFNGFHDIDVHKSDNNSLGKQGDRYKDQITDFLNLKDCGDQGGRSTSLAATMHIGAEYTMPFYRNLSVGLLNSTRINGDYSWTEFRLSANCKPLRWLSGSLSAATGTFGTTAGWVLNLHPKGIGLFLGMDYLLGSVNSDMIPLGKNATLNLGMNIAW